MLADEAVYLVPHFWCTRVRRLKLCDLFPCSRLPLGASGTYVNTVGDSVSDVQNLNGR